MPDNPLVSVVMGVFNGASHLAESIDSVLTQSFSDFEYIVVDDGSTDPAVPALLQRYASQDARIRVLQKGNAGLTQALSLGCNAADGKFIARVDVGDVMQSERLAQQQSVLSKYPECDLVCSAVSFHGPAWEPLWITSGVPGNGWPTRVTSDNVQDGLLADIPHHGSVMFRKSAYVAAGGYRPEFYYGQDWDLWYRLAESGEFFVLPEVLYRARFFPDAISMQNGKRQKSIAGLSLEGHRLRKQELSDKAILEKAALIRPQQEHKKSGSAAGYYFIGEALRRCGDPRCRRYLLSAIKANPLAIKCWVRLLQSMRLVAYSKAYVLTDRP